MARANTTGTPTDKLRQRTDSSLASERAEADRALGAKVADSERRTDETLEKTRTESDRKVERVKHAAESEVHELPIEAEANSDTAQRPAAQAPTKEDAAEKTVETAAGGENGAVEAVQAKAEAVVAQVTERAEQVIESERRRVDELNQKEREQRKRDFLEILRAERRDTDGALGTERRASDLLLRSRDEVLGMISHDIRNYLTALESKAAMMKRLSSADVAAFRALASEISGACQIMSRWANDLVDLSTVDSGALQLNLAPHDPVEVITSSVEAFLPLATKRRIELSVEVPQEPPAVLCDPDRIYQVLGNLLANALKFVGQGGQIRVRLAVKEEDATFSVADNGPGIDEPDQPKIFERYWTSGGQVARGTGLGLYICNRIVEAHGGRIWVESKPGRGSTFYFTLPLAKPAAF
jgi:signal transduction histidine kinase